MKQSKSKTTMISLRCSSEDKEQIKKYANRRNQSIGQYMIDSAIANRERRSRKQKDVFSILVENQENFNILYRYLQESEQNLNAKEIVNMLDDIYEQEMKLWVF